jgi:hypothetical protein
VEQLLKEVFNALWITKKGLFLLALIFMYKKVSLNNTFGQVRGLITDQIAACLIIDVLMIAFAFVMERLENVPVPPPRTFLLCNYILAIFMHACLESQLTGKFIKKH